MFDVRWLLRVALIIFSPSIGPSGQVVVVAEDIAAVVVVTDDTVCLELNDVCDRICLFP